MASLDGLCMGSGCNCIAYFRRPRRYFMLFLLQPSGIIYIFYIFWNGGNQFFIGFLKAILFFYLCLFFFLLFFADRNLREQKTQPKFTSRQGGLTRFVLKVFLGKTIFDSRPACFSVFCLARVLSFSVEIAVALWLKSGRGNSLSYTGESAAFFLVAWCSRGVRSEKAGF